MNKNYDFMLNVKKKEEDSENYQYIITLMPESKRAIDNFGNCIIATLILDKDIETLEYLSKNIPN